MARRARWTPEDYRSRPRDYDPLLCDRIVEAVANGENLVTICEEDRDLPLPATFLAWCSRDSILAAQYELAVRTRSDVLVEEILHEGDGSDAQVARVRVQARQLVVERVTPEKYAPRSYETRRKTDEREAGGVDHTAELRRKLELIARNEREAERAGIPA